MARRARQLSIKECYDILNLQKGADLQAVKSAYRRRAFELHPDLNPGNDEAGKQFQLLNEAYVALSAILKPAEEARARKEAQEQKTDQKTEQEKETQHSDREKAKAQAAYAEQDVLRDLLNDPFARRVFEDIYSELAKQQQPKEEQPKQQAKPAAEKPDVKINQTRPAQPQKPAPLWEIGKDKGVKGVVKDWLRKQIDDEQILRMPAAGLAPGRKIRIQIRKGMSEEISAIEITLPKDFVVGKPIRLRGLGKKVGPWQGDLYLTINPS